MDRSGLDDVARVGGSGSCNIGLAAFVLFEVGRVDRDATRLIRHRCVQHLLKTQRNESDDDGTRSVSKISPILVQYDNNEAKIIQQGTDLKIVRSTYHQTGWPMVQAR